MPPRVCTRVCWTASRHHIPRALVRATRSSRSLPLSDPPPSRYGDYLCTRNSQIGAYVFFRFLRLWPHVVLPYPSPPFSLSHSPHGFFTTVSQTQNNAALCGSVLACGESHHESPRIRSPDFTPPGATKHTAHTVLQQAPTRSKRLATDSLAREKRHQIYGTPLPVHTHPHPDRLHVMKF